MLNPRKATRKEIVQLASKLGKYYFLRKSDSSVRFVLKRRLLGRGTRDRYGRVRGRARAGHRAGVPGGRKSGQQHLGCAVGTPATGQLTTVSWTADRAHRLHVVEQRSRPRRCGRSGHRHTGGRSSGDRAVVIGQVRVIPAVYIVDGSAAALPGPTVVRRQTVQPPHVLRYVLQVQGCFFLVVKKTVL